jgi:uncharacterized iron-regulated membrane protein
MSPFKKATLFLHRWLGFVSGIAVFIVSITGAIYCFQDDIQDVIYSYRKVKVVAQKEFVKPSQLKAGALRLFPKAVVALVIYNGPSRSAQVRMINNKKALAVYYNPYSGSYLHHEEIKDNFFSFIKEVHLHLFLPPKIGKLVNGICVIIFIFIMISGLILWWPKRKSDRKRSFRIKWNGKWKRVNYDLHNVLGFYVTSVAVILAITGLSFSFQWVRNGIRDTANLGKKYPIDTRVFTSDTVAMVKYPDSALAIDKVYQTVKEKSPNAQSILIFTGLKPSNTISVNAFLEPLHFSYLDRYNFDRYSGQLLDIKPYAKDNLGKQLNNMNYDIHTGQIAGFFGKIIAFIASLISASLPVTGLIIYLGKKKITKKTKQTKSKKIDRAKFLFNVKKRRID